MLEKTKQHEKRKEKNRKEKKPNTKTYEISVAPRFDVSALNIT